MNLEIEDNSMKLEIDVERYYNEAYGDISRGVIAETVKRVLMDDPNIDTIVISNLRSCPIYYTWLDKLLHPIRWRRIKNES